MSFQTTRYSVFGEEIQGKTCMQDNCINAKLVDIGEAQYQFHRKLLDPPEFYNSINVL